ncbi:MAG: hypothetical protein K2N41_04605 [Lachnospiraceae bacterium]|nr:hypothetical protein [Lachnospiraceae bacterium]MDE7238975.1 hypothetical protein [Lachnospiraceae bacterium]
MMYKKWLCAIIVVGLLFSLDVNVQAEKLEGTYEEFLYVMGETPIAAEKENKNVEEEIYVDQYSREGIVSFAAQENTNPNAAWVISVNSL